MRIRARWPEFTLIALALAVSVLGFWDIYFSDGASPLWHHHAHLVTTFGWMLLLLAQLLSIGKGNFQLHRMWGRAVLVVAPILVATTAVLTIISAARAVSSGQPDALIVQNVTATLELAAFIVAAFFFRKRREVHGAFLLSTLILFGGIASFFALLSFVPQFEIAGPETFYRFGLAAITAQLAWAGIAVLMFLLRFRTGWPYLLMGALFFVNSFLDTLVQSAGLAEPLTRLVGSANIWATFLAVAVAVFAALWLMIAPREATKRMAPA